ncbi:MAG: hypothetical protein ACPLRZ_11620 [Thermovenabulum sp.]|uniref:hypothetical protein n=1 Tax=Thermovenabulum sp. TaxID=3100335 RepID=UPI003C7BECED
MKTKQDEMKIKNIEDEINFQEIKKNSFDLVFDMLFKPIAKMLIYFDARKIISNLHPENFALYRIPCSICGKKHKIENITQNIKCITKAVKKVNALVGKNFITYYIKKGKEDEITFNYEIGPILIFEIFINYPQTINLNDELIDKLQTFIAANIKENNNIEGKVLTVLKYQPYLEGEIIRALGIKIQIYPSQFTNEINNTYNILKETALLLYNPQQHFNFIKVHTTHTTKNEVTSIINTIIDSLKNFNEKILKCNEAELIIYSIKETLFDEADLPIYPVNEPVLLKLKKKGKIKAKESYLTMNDR